MRVLKTFVALPVLALSAGAQIITVQVGPDPAPLGCPVYFSVTNNTDLIGGFAGCPWKVFDDSGGLVFDADCLIQEVLVGPLGTLNYKWDQVDQSGAQVPPGDYVVEIGTLGGLFQIPFQVGGTEANLHLKGTPAIGTDVIGFGGRNFSLCAPGDPGGLYWLLAAYAQTTGIPTCAGTVPLDFDALLQIHLASPIFTNTVGSLDAAGLSEDPLFPIPDNSALIGLSLVTSFVVFDPSAPCPVTRISDSLPLTIVQGAIPFP